MIPIEMNEKVIALHICNKIKGLFANYSHQELTAMTGLAQSQQSLIRNGRRAAFDAVELLKYSNAFDVTPNFLLEEFLNRNDSDLAETSEKKLTPVTSRGYTDVSIVGMVPAGKSAIIQLSRELGTMLIKKNALPPEYKDSELSIIKVDGSCLRGYGVKPISHVALAKVPEDSLEVGDVIVCRCDKHECSFRTIYRMDGKLVFLPLWPADDEICKDQKTKILGKVIYLMSPA